MIRQDPKRMKALGRDAQPGGRLGKALIRELLNKAVVQQAPEPEPEPSFDPSITPAFDTAAAFAPPTPVAAPQPAPEPEPPVLTPEPEPAAPLIDPFAPPEPVAPSEKEVKARELLDKIDTLQTKSKRPAPKTDKFSEVSALFEHLESQRDADDAAEVVKTKSNEDVLAELEARIEAEEGPAPFSVEAVEETPAHVSFRPPAAKPRPKPKPKVEVQETQTFLTLSQLTESLCAVTRNHLYETAAMRTMIEDLEMPDPFEDPSPVTQAHLQRMASAEEISFEGYLEDIEKLLLETYEHYKNVPQALEATVDPAKSDILGPAGRTLETRRADRKASAKLKPQPPARPAPSFTPPPSFTPSPAADAGRGHLVPPGSMQFTNAPVVPQQPAAHSPQAWQPYGAAPPTTPQPTPSGAPQADPFALDPYTGRPLQGQDPFKLDPFNPYGESAGAPPAATPPAGAVDPFANPYAKSPPPASPPTTPPVRPAPQSAAPSGFQGFGAAPPPARPPHQQTSSFAQQNKAKESLGFDPFADPGESQDPFSWPAKPPQALVEAQQKADADAERFDPFGPESSSIPGEGVPPTNPFGPGNMFGSAGAGAAQQPIYIQDSDDFQQARPRVTAADTKRAFENALVTAGLRGMLEYQNPTAGHGPSHPVLVIYDATTRQFKAPLNPRMSKGDRFQLKDGQIFRVTQASVFSVDGVPCYQELDCKALGKLNMPLRDSWEEPT